MHQLLDSNGRMIGVSCRYQAFEYRRRATLHLVYIDAGIEQDRWPAEAFLMHKGKLAVGSAGEGSSRVKSGPPNGLAEINVGQIRTRASSSDRLFRAIA